MGGTAYIFTVEFTIGFTAEVAMDGSTIGGTNEPVEIDINIRVLRRRGAPTFVACMNGSLYIGKGPTIPAAVNDLFQFMADDTVKTALKTLTVNGQKI